VHSPEHVVQEGGGTSSSRPPSLARLLSYAVNDWPSFSFPFLAQMAQMLLMNYSRTSAVVCKAAGECISVKRLACMCAHKSSLHSLLTAALDNAASPHQAS